MHDFKTLSKINSIVIKFTLYLNKKIVLMSLLTRYFQTEVIDNKPILVQNSFMNSII